MTTSDKIIFYGGGAWGQALAIALSNCNAKSSILVSDNKRMESLNNGITKCFPDIISVSYTHLTLPTSVTV